MGKKALILLIVMVPVLLLSAVIFSHAQAWTEQDLTELEVWTVRPGDTLWTIAQHHRGRTEIRKFIYQIEQLNDLKGHLQPGQQIYLPPGK